MNNEFIAENEMKMDFIENCVDIQDGWTIADLSRIAVCHHS